MKVGMLATSWSPDWNYRNGVYGAKVAGVELLESLLRYSQQIQVYEMFAPPSSYPLWSEFAKRQNQNGIADGRFCLRPAVELSRAVREETFAAFHTHGASAWGNLLALRESAKCHFACTTTMHAISQAFLLQQLSAASHNHIGAADKLVCSSRAQRQAMLNILHCIPESAENVEIPTKVNDLLSLIPLGVNIQRFAPLDKDLCRTIAQLPHDGPIILCLGRLSASAKMDLIPLFRAFRLTLRSYPSAWLLLVGPESFPGYVAYLSEYARELGIYERVIILNSIPEIAKPVIYGAADVFVSVSDNFQESFGITLLEAMACGIPVIATDWNGYRDIVLQGESGYLAPTWWGKCDDTFNILALMGDWEMDQFLLSQSVSYSVEELAQYMINILGDDDLRRMMGSNARQRVEREFSWEKIVACYEHIWQEQPQPDYSSHDINPNFTTPEYWRTFRHYSSHQLSDNTTAVLTDFGRSILSGAETLLRYKEIELILDDDLLDLLMSETSNSPITRQGLCKLAQEEQPIWLEQLVTYHILWLAKQGVVNLISSEN